MQKIKMVFNPAADRGRSDQIAGDLRELANELGGADWIGTSYPGHAIELAAEAARNGYETVVALGGDGTVHEVVNGLMQVDADRRPRLGVIPIGTGNDFALGIGVSKNPFTAVTRLYRDGVERTADVGLARDASGRQEYWCNVFGIGFDAAINIQSRGIPLVHGFALYFLATLWTILLRFDRPALELDIDGVRSTGRHIMLTLGNGTREGGGFMTTPDAKMDDGLLDYLLVDDMSRLKMLRMIPEVMRGTQGRFREVHLGRFRKLALKSDIALPIEIDGEMFAMYHANIREVAVEVVPQALRVVV